MKRTTSSLNRAHSRGSFSRLVFESEHNNGGGHEGRSILYRLCQLVVLIFRAITPSSYIYLFGLWWFEYNPAKNGGNILLMTITLWMCAEALFFPYYYYMFTQLNNLNPKLQHFAATRESRRRLVHNCFNAMKIAGSFKSNQQTEPEMYIRKVIEGWFLDVPLIQIRRGNFASWVGWAFLGKEIAALDEDDKNDIEEIVTYVETQAKWTFEPGFTEGLSSARLTLDPLFATQRPFLVYAAIGFVNAITHIILWLIGFRKRAEFSRSAQTIYYRKGRGTGAGTSQKSSAGLPLVFVHGIGIGFAHYLAVIMNFPKDVDVYLVEWPHVAMQMAASAPTTDESVESIVAILDHDKHPQACFAAHSLGTTLVSWMLHHPTGCRRVASTVLIDPVTFLLCDPTLATMFVYKDPLTEIDFLMHFFLSRELFISNAISRHFNWSHNIMFVEDLSAVDAADAHSYASMANSSEESLNEQKQNGSSGNSGGSGGYTVATPSAVPSTDKAGKAGKAAKAKAAKELDKEGRRKASSPETVAHLGLNHSIVLSSHDAIVPVGQVGMYLEAKARQGHSCFEVIMFHGTHGELFLYPRWVRLVSDKIFDRCGLSR